MFNPSPETDVVKKLKDSLKIDDEVNESDNSDNEDNLKNKENNKNKQRHGVGFKIKEKVVKSVEQVKLLSKFKGDSKKKTLKYQKTNNNKHKPNLTQQSKSKPESDEQSRLDLIFNNFKKKRK